jgi:hypothetical protein
LIVVVGRFVQIVRVLVVLEAKASTAEFARATHSDYDLNDIFERGESVQDDVEWRREHGPLLIVQHDLVSLIHPQLLGFRAHCGRTGSEHGEQQSGQEYFDQEEILHNYDPRHETHVIAFGRHAVLSQFGVRIRKVKAFGQVHARVRSAQLVGQVGLLTFQRSRLQIGLVRHEELNETAVDNDALEKLHVYRIKRVQNGVERNSTGRHEYEKQSHVSHKVLFDHEFHFDKHGPEFVTYGQKDEHGAIIEIQEKHAQDSLGHNNAVHAEKLQAVPSAQNAHKKEQDQKRDHYGYLYHWYGHWEL